jgi:hypothetical protein
MSITNTGKRQVTLKILGDSATPFTESTRDDVFRDAEQKPDPDPEATAAFQNFLDRLNAAKVNPDGSVCRPLTAYEACTEADKVKQKACEALLKAFIKALKEQGGCATASCNLPTIVKTCAKPKKTCVTRRVCAVKKPACAKPRVVKRQQAYDCKGKRIVKNGKPVVL